MQFLAYLTIPILIGVLMSGVDRQVFKAEKSMREDSFVVRQSKTFAWVGIIVALFFGAAMIVMTALANDSVKWWIYMEFFAFFSLGILIAVYCFFWELRVNGDEIRYRCLFKPSQTLGFDAITSVKMKHTPQYEQIILYSGAKKLFALESNCVGYYVFVARLIKEQVKFE